MQAEEEAVQVAVRVRIFHEREIKRNSSLIIRMTRELQGSKTFITNPDTKEVREFKFDYSFNSHKDDPKVGPYATQDSVFEDLGKPVLSAALEGKNVCLFAYGQTGAGKSFSMIGGRSGKNGEGGIIPRTCQEIFKVRDKAIANPVPGNSTAHEITTEVIEIYCEQINDLLLERSKWPPKGFPLRMERTGGFCCPDTIKAPCNDYSMIQKNFDRADGNRSIGAHQLNQTSSRAHTIFKIQYTKTTLFQEKGEAKRQTVVAQLNLVDLAGSERTDIAGTSGQMLEEGKAVNLSLTTLGNTIKALTTPGERPNFRESKLTMLLMKSMTNGKVIMIAAISPASICYNETMSTLRFAERIKLVKIKVAKNITTDSVAELTKQMNDMRQRMQNEIDELRRAKDKGDPAALEELKRIMDDRSEEERLMREGLQTELSRLKETAEERAKRLEAFQKQQDTEWSRVRVGRPKSALKVPHLLNLHEDARLAETLAYPIDKPVVTCGRTNPEKPPILEFNGLGINKNHCVFEYDTKKGLVITPGKGARCFVNGKKITAPTQLKHNNRLWLGNNYAFRVAIPGKEKDGDTFPKKPDGNPDYLIAETELTAASETQISPGEAPNDAHLRHKLNEALRKVEQANLIAADLDINATFSPKIIRNRETKEDNVVVHAELPQGVYTWPWEMFTTRLVDMVSLWQSWQYAMANGQTFQMPDKSAANPYLDDSYQLVGEADVYLACLGNMIENPFDVTLLSMTGVQEGRLKVDIIPLGRDGSEGPWDDEDDNDPFVDNPEEIRNKYIQFQIQIDRLQFDVDLKSGGKPRFKDVFVRYKINREDLDEQYKETKRDASSGVDVKFNYKQNHKVFVDSEMFNHIMKGRLTFQVWGKVADTKPYKVNPTALVMLPPGWKKQMAYIAPDGSIHWDPPGLEGNAATASSPGNVTPVKPNPIPPLPTKT